MDRKAIDFELRMAIADLNDGVATVGSLTIRLETIVRAILADEPVDLSKEDPHVLPITPPDKLVEALRNSRNICAKYQGRFAAAVRDMSWALEHSANDCDTAEELEKYIPICKTARAVQEMNG